MFTSLRRSVLTAFAMSVAAASMITVGNADRVSAATYWSSGSVGYATVPQGVCTYHNSWRRLDASIDPPAIYARNTTAAQDWQWVRYRVFVVDAFGQTVQSSGYSAFVVAYDNVPATFSGRTTFTNVPDGSRIDLRIEWWSPTQQVGALAHRVDSYLHYSGMVGPFGNMSSCAKW